MIILKCPSCGIKIQLEEDRLKTNFAKYRICPNCLHEVSGKVLEVASRICQNVDGWEIYRTNPELSQSHFCRSQIE